MSKTRDVKVVILGDAGANIIRYISLQIGCFAYHFDFAFAGVGKTSILNRFSNKKFDENS